MTDLSLYYQTFMTSGCFNNQMGNQKGLGIISYYLGKCANALKLQTTPGSTLNALPTASKAQALCLISSTRLEKQNQKNRNTTFKDTLNKDSFPLNQ